MPVRDRGGIAETTEALVTFSPAAAAAEAVVEEAARTAAAAAAEQQAAGLRALLALARPAEPTPAYLGAARRAPVPWRSRLRIPLPLLAVLTVQAVLAGNLIHANTAFQDEALYLWAGHLELAHLLEGAPIPPFPTFFSGAPVVYPPIAALADSIGGLSGARILSLCFMLGATCLLWGTTSRLYGRRAAFFAAGVWSVLGPTLHLSAFATFDAMSLFLVALAAWLATGARTREDSTGWILGATAALALANAAKYASAIFDPAVLGMACFCAFPRPGGKVAIRRAALMVTCLTGVLAVLVKLAGLYYAVGIRETTLTRLEGSNTIGQVLGESWGWVGIALVLAFTGAALGMATESSWGQKLLLVMLAGTGLLAPIQQAHIHTTTSLDKHVDFGAWFAMIAGGYAVDRLLKFIRPHAVRAAAAAGCVIALIVPAAIGLSQAKVLFDWPDTSKFLTDLAPYVDNTSGHILVETPSIPEYYLPAGSQWWRWSSTWNIREPDRKSVGSQGVGRPGSWGIYQHYIAEHYFSVIALNDNATRELDEQIAAELTSMPKVYRLARQFEYGNIGVYRIWVLRHQAHATRAVTR
jgi:hypothetical protein